MIFLLLPDAYHWCIPKVYQHELKNTDIPNSSCLCTPGWQAAQVTFRTCGVWLFLLEWTIWASVAWLVQCKGRHSIWKAFSMQELRWQD